MEISDSSENQNSNKIAYLKKFLLTWFGVLLIISIFIYLIYVIERYILYYTINSLLKFLLCKFISSEKISKNNNIIIITIIISIFVHIKFFQKIIISFVFIAGGVFARFNFYNDFSKIILQQINISKELSMCLFLSSQKDILKYYNYILNFQKAINNQKKLENTTFELKKFKFTEILNNIIYLFEKLKEKNYKDEEIKNSLLDKLKSYNKAIEPYTNFSTFDLIFKFYYNKSVSFIKQLFIFSFENRICNNIIISKDFDAYILYPEQNGNNKNSENKILYIYCGQNAFIVEMFNIYKNNFKFFLGLKEMTLLFWNYAGYGSRKGFPSFTSIDNDIEELKNYIINNYSGYKIIIHGISIGGYPAIKLAKILNENDKFKSNVCLIADRTYSDIDLIVETFSDKFGYILKNIYNLFFPKLLYYSDNIQNYIDVPLENKFIFFDEEDKIINYKKASLIYNLTTKYYKEIILPKISKYKQFIKLKNMTKSEFNSIKLNIKRIKNSVKDDNFIMLYKNINRNDMEQFLMYFLVFGYPFNINKEIFYDKTIFAKYYIDIPLIFKNIYEENKINFNTNLFDFFSALNFLFIKSNLSIPFNDKEIIGFKFNNDEKEFNLQKNFNESLLKYFGFVHRIFCEHNGTWNNNDELYLQKFLELKGFISDI